MSIFGSPIKEVTAAGVTLENNGLARLDQILIDLGAKAGPEVQQLIAKGRAELGTLLISAEQAGEALITSGKQGAKELIDHAAQYEVMVTFSIRLKAPPKA